MLGSHEYESYGERGRDKSSKFKGILRSLGRRAAKAMNSLGSRPNNFFDSGAYARRQEDWGGKAEVPRGRELVLPAIHNYTSNRELQPNYSARIHDQKGETVIPLDCLTSGLDSVMLVYELKNESSRRYVIFARDPNPLSEDGSEDAMKLSVVCECPKVSYKDPARFTCRTSRETTITDPHLTEAVVIGGNYGGDTRLLKVVGLKPQHDKPTVGLSDATFGLKEN